MVFLIICFVVCILFINKYKNYNKTKVVIGIILRVVITLLTLLLLPLFTEGKDMYEYIQSFGEVDRLDATITSMETTDMIVDSTYQRLYNKEGINDNIVTGNTVSTNVFHYTFSINNKYYNGEFYIPTDKENADVKNNLINVSVCKKDASKNIPSTFYNRLRKTYGKKYLVLYYGLFIVFGLGMLNPKFLLLFLFFLPTGEGNDDNDNDDNND